MFQGKCSACDQRSEWLLRSFISSLTRRAGSAGDGWLVNLYRPILTQMWSCWASKRAARVPTLPGPGQRRQPRADELGEHGICAAGVNVAQAAAESNYFLVLSSPAGERMRLACRR